MNRVSYIYTYYPREVVIMASELLYLSHCMVLEAPQSARDIAHAVGKPYSTLLREVNPYDTGAKLGV